MGIWRFFSFSPEISPREVKLRDEFLAKVKQAGVSTIAKGPLKDELGMSGSELKLIIKLLVNENEIRVLGNNLIAASFVEEFRASLLELFSTREIVELGDFREKTGLSRNMAVALLEHFDSEGMTRRQGSGRALVQKQKKA